MLYPLPVYIVSLRVFVRNDSKSASLAAMSPELDVPLLGHGYVWLGYRCVCIYGRACRSFAYNFFFPRPKVKLLLHSNGQAYTTQHMFDKCVRQGLKLCAPYDSADAKRVVDNAV